MAAGKVRYRVEVPPARSSRHPAGRPVRFVDSSTDAGKRRRVNRHRLTVQSGDVRLPGKAAPRAGFGQGAIPGGFEKTESSFVSILH